jgi:hypothetical protein
VPRQQRSRRRGFLRLPSPISEDDPARHACFAYDQNGHRVACTLADCVLPIGAAERDPRAFDALLAAALRWREPVDSSEVCVLPASTEREGSAGRFSARPSPAYRHQGRLVLQDLLHMSEAELAKCDIAEVNLACAEDLPGSDRIDRPRCHRTLDRWAGRVRERTNRAVFEREPERWDHSWAIFRIHVMISVL